MIPVDAAVITAALLLDLAIGDPRWLPHPVVAMGRMIAFLDRYLRVAWLNERVAGLFLLLIVVAVSFCSVRLLIDFLAGWHYIAGWCATVVISASCLATHSLHRESALVARALELGDLPAARRYLSNIVGRDTDDLEEPDIWRALIETVAENSSDGIIAPLFWLTAGGAGVAIAYKAVSTLDSMVGYRNERYLQLGWASARMDDLLNIVPARVTALLMIIAAPFAGGSAKGAFKMTMRDCHNHPSPNSGYPEAAASGALGVRLGGVSTYAGVHSLKQYIGDPINPCDRRSYVVMVRLMYIATLLMAILSVSTAFFLRGYFVPFI